MIQLMIINCLMIDNNISIFKPGNFFFFIKLPYTNGGKNLFEYTFHLTLKDGTKYLHARVINSIIWAVS